MSLSLNRRSFLAGSAVVVPSIAALLSGCSSSSSNAGTGSASGSASSGSGAVYRTLEEIQDSGTVVIGVFSDKSPFGYVDENGEYQGYDVVLARQIGEDLGVELDLESVEAANRVEYLQTGKVDIILANFTVTDERAEQVDFAKAYMNVALGVVSHADNVITDLADVTDETVIVITGTTAETYLTENYPDLALTKYDTYANAKTAFENDATSIWANDNTEVIAFANTAADGEYVVGIEELGDLDTIAPAVSKGNDTLLDWLNEELVTLGSQNFFHEDYEETLLDTYGADYEETLVVEPSEDSE